MIAFLVLVGDKTGNRFGVPQNDALFTVGNFVEDRAQFGFQISNGRMHGLGYVSNYVRLQVLKQGIQCEAWTMELPWAFRPLKQLQRLALLLNAGNYRWSVGLVLQT